MTGWKHNSILRGLLGSLSVSLLFVVAVSFSNPRHASAQSSAADVADDGTVAAIAADDDSAGNIDRPAPASDYDLPADGAASATADTETADDSDDQVLELPQVINPATYSTVSYAPASHVPALASSRPNDADGSADPPDVVTSNVPADSQGDPDVQSADASGSGNADDVQNYVDQANSSGPVVVYAAPVYVPMYPVAAQPNPLPRPYTALPMYSALSNRQLPIYSGLGPVTPSRYGVAGGSRLWGSPIGQGFGMARGTMMGGFSHAR